MADNFGIGGSPNTDSTSFNALVAVLQANGLQMSALLNTLNGNLAGIGLIRVVAPPATSSSPGVAGDFAVDATHFYWAIGNSSWLRVVGSTF